MSKWIPERDACDECHECDYFLHDYWNCQGEPEPCHEFYPKLGSNKKNSFNKKQTLRINNDEDV